MGTQITDTSGQFTDILDELYHSFHINQKDIERELVKDPKELMPPESPEKVMYIGSFNAGKKQRISPSS